MIGKLTTNLYRQQYNKVEECITFLSHFLVTKRLLSLIFIKKYSLFFAIERNHTQRNHLRYLGMLRSRHQMVTSGIMKTPRNGLNSLIVKKKQGRQPGLN